MCELRSHILPGLHFQVKRKQQEGIELFLSTAITSHSSQGKNTLYGVTGSLYALAASPVTLASPPADAVATSTSTIIVLFYITLLLFIATLAWLLATYVCRRRTARRSVDNLARAQRDADLQLLSIAQTANLLLSKYDASGHLVYMSPGIKRLTGIAAAEFVAGNENLENHVHPSDRHHLEQAREVRARNSREEIEFE